MVVEVCSRRDPDFCRMHQVRNLVLNDAQGAVEGMVLVLLDVTERYSAEERFERTFNANPAPAVICSLADLRYVKVNQGFLEMTGYARQDVLDKTVRELDVGRHAAARGCAATAGRRPHDSADGVLHRGAGRQQAGGGGGPAHRGGRAALHAVHLQRPGAARSAETALRHSEQRFATAFRLAPVPMTLSTAEGELLEVNDAFVATTGYDAATLSRDEDAGAAVDRSARLRPRHGLAGAGRQRAQPGNGAAHARGALLDCCCRPRR